MRLIFLPKNSYSVNIDIYEELELLRKDLKTMEDAFYKTFSGDFSVNQETSVTSNTLDQNSEEVLTRHLLKLSEVEKQFQKLTN